MKDKKYHYIKIYHLYNYFQITKVFFLKDWIILYVSYSLLFII